jgi:hypothetical protein
MNPAARLKETDCLKAWAFFWVLSTIGGAVLGAMGGGILGFILGGLGVRMHTIKLLCGAFGFLLGIPVSYLFFQLAISKFVLTKVSASSELIQSANAVAGQDKNG